MNDVRRRLAFARTLEKTRKFDLDEKHQEMADARALVDNNKVLLNRQKLMIEKAITYAQESQQKSGALKSVVMEVQADYFSSLYAELADIEKKLQKCESAFGECQQELLVAHARKQLANKNRVSMENEKLMKEIRQDMKDNFLPVEGSREI